MNTERSEAIIRRFRNPSWTPKRKVVEHEGPVHGAPEDVFPLLCPAREADWIPGWDADIVYSETGYAALGDVFRSPGSTGFGEGVWVFVGFERDRTVELIQVTRDILVHVKILLTAAEPDDASSRTAVRWRYVITSLTPEGAGRMSGELISEATFRRLLGTMDHYLRHGEMVGAAGPGV